MERWLQYIRFGFKNVFVYSKQTYKKNLTWSMWWTMQGLIISSYKMFKEIESESTK